MTFSKDDERRALVAQPPAPVAPSASSGVAVLLLCCSFVAVSASLINFNKYLMSPTIFPYAVPLTWLHMFTSSIFTWVLYLISGDRFCPAMTGLAGRYGEINRKFIPIAVMFALSIALSNEAYLYCSVPFLQMMKEFNVVLVFICGLILAAEKFDLNLISVLAIVTLGCVLSVHGEMRFSAFGFALQAGCQVSEVVKIMTQQIVTQGQKLDPLTTVMILSPQCLLALSMAMPFVWDPEILTSIQNYWPLLLLNCGNALLLNIVVASLIRYASGLTMVITGVVKDITIVSAASLLFSAQISSQQCLGFMIAIFGVMVYSIVRSAPEAVAQHGMVLTVAHALFRWPLQKTPKASSEHAV